MVPYVSTIFANKTEPVHLFVRERDGTPAGEERRPVLMLHGKTSPALPGFDLNHLDHDQKSYSWAGYLAQQGGFDVFIMDLQGSGRSPRPKMDDPCNANLNQQNLLIPNPLSTQCSPAYPFQLNNSQSDWDELDRVVQFIRNEAHPEDAPLQKVRLVGWSAAAFQIGPYAMQHSGDVHSILFLGPAFRSAGPSNPPSTLPVPGFPMNIGTKDDFKNPWNNEQNPSCVGQREDGIVDVVWDAIMDNDVFGHHWGPVLQSGKPEGRMRLRNAVWWGWNTSLVQLDTKFLGKAVPVLIVYGGEDKAATTAPLSIVDLYNAIQGERKLMFKIACTGHFMPWESRFKDLHDISEQWLTNTHVFTKEKGSFLYTLSNDIIQQ